MKKYLWFRGTQVVDRLCYIPICTTWRCICLWGYRDVGNAELFRKSVYSGGLQAISILCLTTKEIWEICLNKAVVWKKIILCLWYTPQQWVRLHLSGKFWVANYMHVIWQCCLHTVKWACSLHYEGPDGLAKDSVKETCCLNFLTASLFFWNCWCFS